MITPNEALRKFRGRLETTDREDRSASSRQRRLRGELDAALDIEKDFLTGAYRRHTKTKPLRDVDIMIVLRDISYLDRHPHDILELIRSVLAPIYGDDRVTCDRFAVRVDFGVKIVDDVSDEVVSFDVVPAFEHEDHYLIPDDVLGEWIYTNPEIHRELATAANQAFSEQWKPLVKMVKKWNDEHDHPIEPSFLIEVMALNLIDGPWTGDHRRELRQFFASAAARIAEGWSDPAKLGPDVSGPLDADPLKMDRARRALRDAEAACTKAINLERQGRTGDALKAWRDLFGPLFPLS
ncbi:MULTISPECIES: CBASS oligonucleotide cyclase [unclassified Amycolatopsis]|uniref:CBASS oligonucleotide cyclase n=1 Tax=unclassified Amycolatopsis TaxID=2618356 RepID=UPI002874E7DD|nr:MULTISPECIES: CBASS oligonucleotide cyclase [unclassified Amycolatopsis]MDS0133205.1 nucleotidyltransferase [Amycolatopsis sp. 505]MDS0146435.1 nucleotidyltransferase [Amycolatopsis sp. CM201R]